MEKEKQLTTVEWLEDTLYPYLNKEDKEYTDVLFNKAKEMEKEQIMDAYRINPNNENWSNSGIDYYNETFKSE
jgi:hypothetical protein